MTNTHHKVALVTGAARGIGLAAAKRFLAEGWRVALLDIERELLDQTIKTIAAPDTILAIHCDVSDPKAVANAVAKVGGSLRTARCTGQQRRHRDLQATARDEPR